MVVNFEKENSLLNGFIAEMRDKDIQKDSMRFRKNLCRVGQIMAYEISKTFTYSQQEVITTLGSTEVSLPENKVVIAVLLRSGLAMHQGLLDFFDAGQNAFVSIYRKFEKSEKSKVRVKYISCPDLNGKTLILADPMLATGISAVHAWNELQTYGKPEHTHFAVILASQEGVVHLKRSIPQEHFTLWVGAIDDELTAQAYIVPGLGDAGDLAYGSKEE